MDTDVGLEGVAASLVLVAVAIVLSWRQGLGIERTIAWASTRAFVQLLIVGSALSLVLADDAPVVLSVLWVVAMVLIAAYRCAGGRRRCLGCCRSRSWPSERRPSRPNSCSSASTSSRSNRWRSSHSPGWWWATRWRRQ